jgi:hypothetical protein
MSPIFSRIHAPTPILGFVLGMDSGFHAEIVAHPLWMLRDPGVQVALYSVSMHQRHRYGHIFGKSKRAGLIRRIRRIQIRKRITQSTTACW